MKVLRRWLATEGKVLDGEIPTWYFVLRAAKYLGVAPWELADQPIFWMRVALATESAELEAEKAREHRQASKKKG